MWCIYIYIIYIHIYIIYIVYIYILYQRCRVFFETGTYIYSVELKGPYYVLGSCQKIFDNIEYLDWLKMHLPAWSKVF